ncbi:MAG TPA: hypothetical protein VJZ78_05015 [Anaerolineales bacterium]|nr:hypothetical protein [Anaerolineales bacterium]
MYAPLSHIHPSTLIQRKRVLPVPGRILVGQGQVVSPMEVVAETEFSSEHVLLDVAALLHISSEEADSLINCHVGDRLSVNQVIAPARGFFSFPVLSPVNGHVILVGEGQVLLEAGDSKFELLANYQGKITQIFQDKGVEITAEGSIIQGLWGNGKFGFGSLQSNFVKGNSDNILNIDKLNTNYRGSIVFANHCSDKKALKKAADLPVRGLILGSISSDLLSQAIDLDLPIMVTEGFGHHRMSSLVYKLLQDNINKDVILIGNNFDPYTGVRPEVFIPLPSSGKKPLAMDFGFLSVGSQVRIILNPGLSGVGTVSRFLEDRFEFPSGLKLPAAEIRLENGKMEIVPLVNLEVIN